MDAPRLSFPQIDLLTHKQTLRVFAVAASTRLSGWPSNWMSGRLARLTCLPACLCCVVCVQGPGGQ